MVLLGDAAHAMQPNLGQGGCMAIEDGYALAVDLARAFKSSGEDAGKVDVPGVLKQYQNERLVRVSTIHGMTASTAIARNPSRAAILPGPPGHVSSVSRTSSSAAALIGATVSQEVARFHRSARTRGCRS